MNWGFGDLEEATLEEWGWVVTGELVIGDAVDYGLGCFDWTPTSFFINGLGLMVILIW